MCSTLAANLRTSLLPPAQVHKTVSGQIGCQIGHTRVVQSRSERLLLASRGL
jgi:hypothetical protein